jgi:hypothetical protein
MRLRDLLSQRRSALSRRWLDHLLAERGEEGVPPRRDRDAFADPVGHTLATELPRLVDVLGGDGELSAASAPLEAIIRIRAVQELAPSQAVGFVHRLRDAVRAELADELAGGALGDELAALEGRIERLTLLAFDVFVSVREELSRLRQEELRRSVAALLRRWQAGELPVSPSAQSSIGGGPSPAPPSNCPGDDR